MRASNWPFFTFRFSTDVLASFASRWSFGLFCEPAKREQHALRKLSRSSHDLQLTINVFCRLRRSQANANDRYRKKLIKHPIHYSILLPCETTKTAELPLQFFGASYGIGSH